MRFCRFLVYSLLPSYRRTQSPLAVPQQQESEKGLVKGPLSVSLSVR